MGAAVCAHAYPAVSLFGLVQSERCGSSLLLATEQEVFLLFRATSSANQMQNKEEFVCSFPQQEHQVTSSGSDDVTAGNFRQRVRLFAVCWT